MPRKAKVKDAATVLRQYRLNAQHESLAFAHQLRSIPLAGKLCTRCEKLLAKVCVIAEGIPNARGLRTPFEVVFVCQVCFNWLSELRKSGLGRPS